VVVRHDGAADPRDLASSPSPRARRDAEVLERLLAPLGPGAGTATSRLIRHFATLGGVLGADPASVAAITSAAAADLLGAHRELLEHSLRDRLLDAPVTASGKELERYLVATMGDSRTERLRALFLDGGNRLLSDELMAQGKAARVSVSARAIIARALALDAAALLLVHNHPGGRLEPSPDDIAFTRAIVEAGRHAAIMVHDHLIVAGSTCVSLRARGLLA
jgi:DNA repair protein RadC